MYPFPEIDAALVAAGMGDWIPEPTEEDKRLALSARMRELGRKGGNRTKELYGRPHFVRAGKLGWIAYVEEYWNGDYEAAARYFSARGLAAQDPVPENGAWNVRRLMGGFQ